MYGNNFYNPFSYQVPYQTANFARNSANLAGGLTRNSALSNTALSGISKTGGLGNILGKFSFTGFLNGASKTLNVINQAIPVFYQVKPMINNAKTMFRIIGAVKDEKPINNRTSQNVYKNTYKSTNINTKQQKNTIENRIELETENPTFFI